MIVDVVYARYARAPGAFEEAPPASFAVWPKMDRGSLDGVITVSDFTRAFFAYSIPHYHMAVWHDVTSWPAP